MKLGMLPATSTVLAFSLLAEARQILRDAGVLENNITVTGESGDPNSLVVCDHNPDNVAPSEPVTLEVAQNCPDDDSKTKKKKKSSSSRNRK